MISPDPASCPDFENNRAAYEGHCNLTTVQFAEIPLYLHDSAFYKSLGRDEVDALIGVPRHCFKSDDSVSNSEELVNMFHVMMFWGVDEIPFTVLDFLKGKHSDEWQHLASEVLDPNNCNALLVYFANNCSLDGAIQSNRWQIMFHWMQHNPPEEEKSFLAIFHLARYGLLDAVKKLREHEYPVDSSVCVAAAEQGHVHCVQYFHESGIALTNVAATAAAKYGRIDCLKYLLEHGCPVDESACAGAAECGSIECLQFLHQSGCPWDDAVTNEATRHNHTACLLYALQHSCPVHKDAYLWAAAHSVTCVQMLYEHNPDIKWGEDIANNAARYGQLDTLKFVIEHGCPTDSDTISAALEYTGNRLPCLQYLIEVEQIYMDEQGFPFTEALMRADVECVQYFLDIGCPCVVRRMRYITLDLQRDKELLECIDRTIGRGWTCSEYFVQLLFSRNLPMCHEFLIKEGYVPSDTTPEDKAEHESDTSSTLSGIFDDTSSASSSDTE